MEAKTTHTAEPKTAHNIASISISGWSAKLATDRIPPLMVSDVPDPKSKAPRNSVKQAMIEA